MAGAGLDRPVTEVLGISVDDGPSGLVSLPVHDYLRNSFGAVQGGVMALLGEVAAAEALGADTGVGAAEPVVTDLQVAYLALGRVGSHRVPGADARRRGRYLRVAARSSSCSTRGPVAGSPPWSTCAPRRCRPGDRWPR